MVEKPVALVPSRELLTGSCQSESECAFSQDLQVVSGQQSRLIDHKCTPSQGRGVCFLREGRGVQWWEAPK